MSPHPFTMPFLAALRVQHKRLVVWLSILAVLQLSTMTWLPLVKVSRGMPGMQICSAQALQSKLAADDGSTDTLPGGYSGKHCPLCSHYVPLLDALDKADVVALRTDLSQQRDIDSHRPPRLQQPWRPHTARAPPLHSSTHRS